jgi:hypothetical protein
MKKQGLIRGAIEEAYGMRRQQVFRLTAKGLPELKQWVTRPITREEVVRGQQDIMLRFALSETAVGPGASVELLRSLEASLQIYVTRLHDELKEMPAMMPTSGRLAFECGVRGNQALLEWTRFALTTYEKKKGGRS